MNAIQLVSSIVGTLIAHPVYVIIALFFGNVVYQRMKPFPEDEEGGPEKIKDIDMWNSLLKTDNILVVDFYATWCPPCRSAAPVYCKMSKEEAYQGKIQFLKCDVDKASDVSSACGIRAMPTFKVFQHGKEIAVIQGWSESKLRSTLSDVLRKSSS